ncbi:hypothetical protein M2447_000623 [Ereboglobus sp. PH5-10]|uniref:hypothetical protein n=1 Tax=Ereboglobus sp. PH5-10 TaxID=2940629 RepID=UPI00240611C4|nr:hypothetical protein [Ereboglobus sp. PH5-10]MDF9826542.1 hypothetical protein [Ereboglobus sp. PH5-10]
MSKKAYAEFKKMYDLAWKYNKESHRLAEAVTKDYEAMIVAYLAFFNAINDVPHEIKKASDALKAKDPEGWKTGEKVLTDLQNNSNFRDVALISTTGGMLTTLRDAEARVMKHYNYIFEIKKWHDRKVSGKITAKAKESDVFKDAKAHFAKCQSIVNSILGIKGADHDVMVFVKITETLWNKVKKGSEQIKAADNLAIFTRKELGRASKLKANALPTGYVATLKALLPEYVKLYGLVAGAYKVRDGVATAEKQSQNVYTQLGKAIEDGMKRMSSLLTVVRKPRWNIQGLAKEFDAHKKTSSSEMLKLMRGLEADWVTDKKSFETLKKCFASGGSFNLALEAKLHENPKDSPLRTAIFEYNENFVMGSPCVNSWTGAEMRAHEK